MKLNKKILFIIASTALILMLLTITVLGYFQEGTYATGTIEVEFKIGRAVIEENDVGKVRYIKVANTGEYYCFVRIKIFTIGLTEGNIRIWRKLE